MNWINWKGIKSDTIKGLMICELPPITKPEMKAKATHIDGVDGSIIEELGYQSYDKAIVIGLKGNFDIDEVIEYFSGRGDVIFSNEADKKYKAVIVDTIEYARVLRYRMAKIIFHVQPYKYLATGNTKTIDTSALTSYTINNIGNTKSKPKMAITGSGEIEVKLNGITQFIYVFPDGETTVTFDSELQDAYDDGILKNRNMNGNFIELEKGENVISWTGNIASITFENWSRWL